MQTENQRRHFERPTLRRQEFPAARRTVYLIGVVFIGFLSGALGFMVFSILLQPVYPAYQSGYFPPSTVVSIDKALSTEFIASQGNRLVLGIFEATPYRTDEASSNLPDQNLLAGSGIIVTSDGWIMTDRSVYRSGVDYEVYVGGSFAPVEEVRIDDYLGLVYLKIGAVNLTPVSFAENPLRPGQVLILHNAPFDDVTLGVVYVDVNAYLRTASTQGYVFTSSEFSAYEGFSPRLAGSLPFSFFFDEGGSLAAVGRVESGETLLFAARNIKLSLEQVLRDSEYIDLGIWYAPGELFGSASFVEPRGVIVFHPIRYAVRAGSVAARAGIAPGDRIIAINGDDITHKNDFDYVWRKHQHSDLLRFQVIRNGEPIDLTVPPS